MSRPPPAIPLIGLLLRRLLAAIPIVLLVSALVFFLVEAAPGDPSVIFTGPGGSPHVNEAQRRILGLDEPVGVRFLHWMRSSLTLDFGSSFADQRPVREKVLEALPHTLLLSGTSLAIGFAFGIGLALVSAARPRRFADHLISSTTLLVASTPIFWLAGLAVSWLAVAWGLFPSGKEISLALRFEPGLHVVDRLHHLALPALLLGGFLAAHVARFTRASLLENLDREFVRAARARGASRRRALLRHVLPVSLHATIALFGLSVPYLVGGAVLVETVFDWPGMGTLLVGAMTQKDFPVVAAGTLALAFLAVAGNLAADLLSAWLDPRFEA